MPREDHQAYEHARGGVDPGPSSKKHHKARDDDAHRGKRVTEDVEESGPRVEVVMVMPLKDEGDDEVGRETDDRDNQHGAGNDRFRVRESRDGLAEYFRGDDEKRRAIRERGEHFHAAEAEGVFRARRPCREPDGPIAQGEGKDVEKHMRRVGKEGKAPGEKAADHFRDKSKARDQYREKELVPRRAAQLRTQSMNVPMFMSMPWRVIMVVIGCAAHGFNLPGWRAIRGLEPTPRARSRTSRISRRRSFP